MILKKGNCCFVAYVNGKIAGGGWARILNDEIKGYEQSSLSVAKDNYAFKMYKKLGFKIACKQGEDYLMILKLKQGS